MIINVKCDVVDIHYAKAGILFEQIANNPSVHETQLKNINIYITYKNGYLFAKYTIKDLKTIKEKYSSDAYQIFKEYQVKKIDSYTYYFFDDALKLLYQKHKDEAFNVTFAELLEQYFYECVQSDKGDASEIMIMLSSFFKMEQNVNKYSEQQRIVEFFIDNCSSLLK